MNPAAILMVEALSLQKVYESCSDFDPPGWPDFWCDHEIVCYLTAFNENPCTGSTTEPAATQRDLDRTPVFRWKNNGFVWLSDSMGARDRVS